MTIQLPKDVEGSINAQVLLGRFASVDDALAEAWRTFLRQKPSAHRPAGPEAAEASPDPILGSMRDYADEMDEIVAEAMKRREEPWRTVDVE